MHVNYPSHDVRLVVHSYFIVFFLALEIIGKECSKAQVKACLIRDKKVQLNRMVGWVEGFSFASTFWHLKSIPGGVFMSIYMLATTLLAPASVLAVGGLINSVQIPGRCEFVQGLVLNPSGPFDYTGPPVNGLPQHVALNAQLTSTANGGLQGVYQKVNSDLTFSAQLQDVLAAWICTNVNDDITYVTGTKPADIIQDLQDRNYLYRDYFAESEGQSLGYEHLVIWGTSTADSSPWDVKLSIDTGGAMSGPRTMTSMGCAVNSHAADDILSSINTTWVLQDWAQGLQGGCYEGSGTPMQANATIFIEQFLNSMLMVQAGNDNLLNHPTGDSETQGCLITVTNLPTVILVLIALVGVLFVILLVYWVVLLLIILWYGLRRRREAGYDPTLLECVPSGLTSWILHAARENAMARRTVLPREAKQLKDWRFQIRAVGEDGMKAAILFDEEEAEGVELIGRGVLQGGLA
jgi:hypothetical protein